MRARDIAIAGCGIAGLACAILLRKAGHRVTLYDRLVSPQPIGSGLILQPVGLAVLDELGIGERMRDLGAPIKRLFGRAAPSGRVVLDVRYDALGRDAPHGVAAHRGALFQLLYEAASAVGAAFESAREVVGVDAGAVRFSDGRYNSGFDLVLDALGARSPLSPKPTPPLAYGALWASLDWPGAAGFDPHALEQRYEYARKMVGVLPIGCLPGSDRRQVAFFWSLRGVDHAAWLGARIESWKDDVLRLWPQTRPLLDQITSHDDLVFARYAHRTLRTPISRGVVHVGDSWHCASPQLGQGANMALLDALALARALDSQGDLDLALSEYARLRLWHIRLYQLASWAFTPAYQSDSIALAWLRDWIVAPLARIPPAPAVLAALVAGAVGSPLRAMPGIDR